MHVENTNVEACQQIICEAPAVIDEAFLTKLSLSPQSSGNADTRQAGGTNVLMKAKVILACQLFASYLEYNRTSSLGSKSIAICAKCFTSYVRKVSWNIPILKLLCTHFRCRLFYQVRQLFRFAKLRRMP